MSDDTNIEIKSVSLTDGELARLIMNRKSFSIKEIDSMDVVVSRVEKEIEGQGMRCRIYTSRRSALLAAGLIPTGVTQAVAATAAIGIGVHRLFTWNPDWEISKGTIYSSMAVIYKKKK